MASRRAPGGGRKPMGPFKGKSETITTRVTRRTRVELEGAAKRKGHSLSQEIERRLDDSLRKDSETPAHIKALAQAMIILASNIERSTAQRWHDDAFTGAALRQGVDMLLRHFAPTAKGEAVPPPKVKETANSVEPELGALYGNPNTLGQMEAGMVITMIESQPENYGPVPRVDFSDPWGYGQIRRDLGSGRVRSRKIENKERN